uniref:Uncharacterized protein n=1 Tax=Loxodonta africana TaxID=9785 RepID=G3TVW6_LOXAF
EMLCVWLFRQTFLNGYHQRHIHLHSQQFRQIHLDTRMLIFGQNRNHILHSLLNKNRSRRHCHRDTRMLWKHKALQKYMEDLNKEYLKLDQCLQRICVNEGDQRSLNQRHAELVSLAAIYQEILEAEQAIENLNKQEKKSEMCRACSRSSQ